VLYEDGRVMFGGGVGVAISWLGGIELEVVVRASRDFTLPNPNAQTTSLQLALTSLHLPRRRGVERTFLSVPLLTARQPTSCLACRSLHIV
jgi:hypothetical protein